METKTSRDARAEKTIMGDPKPGGSGAITTSHRDVQREARRPDKMDVGESKFSKSRPKTMSRRDIQREERRRQRAGELLEIIPYARPVNRVQCRSALRPCLFVACKYHLYLDVNPETGSIKMNFPDMEVWELEETCSLDVAERGGVTLEEVGEILNLTRERVRQVEVTGLSKMRGVSDEYDMDAFIGWEPGQDPRG